MQLAPVLRHRGAVGFVIAAIAATVAIVLLTQGHGSTARVHLTGPGAAPGPSVLPRHVAARIPGSSVSPQQAADDASERTVSMAPLSPHDFAAPVAQYRAYAGHARRVLTVRVRELNRALRADDRVAAEAAWLRADSTFARIGAAYGALGSLGDAIDGASGGLARGARDPHFTGLQRIESGLWGGVAPAALVPYGSRLTRDVSRLGGVLRNAPIDPLTYATRAHEILEDVQRDRLSRTTPSDSGVRATADGLTATREVLATLTPILAGRGDGLGRSRYWLGQLGRTLASIRHRHGGRYPPLSALSRTERETLNGRMGATLEALDTIPGELETIRPPVIPRIR